MANDNDTLKVYLGSSDAIPLVSFTSNKINSTAHAEKKFYENNTFIDWTNESTIVSSNSTIATKKWLIIIIASLTTGYITTFIDLISVWLNDLKKGLCFSKIDKWSLLNPYLTCPSEDWYNWSKILFELDSKLSTVFLNFPIYLTFASIWILIAAYITISKNSLIKQSGIPEIKAIISGLNYDLKNYLGVRTLIYKTIGLSLVVSSGVWLGKEGPLVHVSCCIINIIFNLIFTETEQHEGLRRELLSAAVATGISVAFNSPIGGVLFVLECIPSYFSPTKIMWNSFVSATVAVVVLTGFKIFTEGENFYEQDLFQVNFGNFSWLFMEIIPFIILGVLGGYYGFLFTKLNLKFSSSSWKQFIQTKLSSFLKVDPFYGKYLEIFLILLLTTLLNFPFEITRLPLDAYLKILFTDCPANDTNPDKFSNSSNFMCLTSDTITILKLCYILIQGFILSTYTFGLTLPGGVLMPSLVLGATTGRLIGIISLLIQSKFSNRYFSTCTELSCLVSPSSYAVVGAGAFMAGITKLTMCAVVIIFELTGAVTYVLPIMCAVMISKFVNDKLCNENIYDSWLKEIFNSEDNFFNSNNPEDFIELNKGKGNGLCDFTNSTVDVKAKLPDVSIERIMISTRDVKLIQLLPEDEPYTVSSLLDICSNDNHEGYPIILNYSNPISLGYINKQELYSNILSIENPHIQISFQIDNLSREVLSQQLRYEQLLDEGFARVRLITENSFIIVNNRTPLVLVLEIFEKLSLNYLIIMNSDTKHNELMTGFVDRFLISRLINSKFESLQDEFIISNDFSEFEIDDGLEVDELMNLRRERLSIELIT